MKTKITFLFFTTMILFAAGSVAIAQAKLQINVITSSADGFWVNSTLIYGEKDAILIDTPFTQSDAHRLTATILESKKNLTTVYVTHAHPDHYFGFSVIKHSFPDARIVALPSTINQIKDTWETKVKTWKPMYGANVTANPIIPEALQGTILTLEGETLQIFGEVQGDTRDSSYIWIPSLKAVLCGDIVYNGVYPWTLETIPAERTEWIGTLDKIAALKPSVVVAGHKKPDLKDDPSSLQFTRAYLTYYDKALESSRTAEEFRSKIKKRFPDLGLEVILKLASDAAFSSEGK